MDSHAAWEREARRAGSGRGLDASWANGASVTNGAQLVLACIERLILAVHALETRWNSHEQPPDSRELVALTLLLHISRRPPPFFAPPVRAAGDRPFPSPSPAVVSSTQSGDRPPDRGDVLVLAPEPLLARLWRRIFPAPSQLLASGRLRVLCRPLPDRIARRPRPEPCARARVLHGLGPRDAQVPGLVGLRCRGVPGCRRRLRAWKSRPRGIVRAQP
ncbi:hypothetical protein AAT19DRAFT_16554 [Rhodotorula toruloides]|uniref:Uncharacterized protein n=1 Tax=Rhodotorula toruloides TaxID=5286 RepID=A0A2T0A3R5_RHOTO|nr:hypothetical protein AAT19DRAFT_16554 [Rhodotorula toruloides]